MKLTRTAAVTALALSLPATAHAVQFTLTDLGTLGGLNSSANAIASNGYITGTSRSAGSTLSSEAFLYDGSMHNVGFSGRNTSAYDVNSSGRVVGSIDAVQQWQYTHAYIYDSSSGSTTELGTFGGKHSWANAVNEAGLVVGKADLSSGSSHAFLYDGTAMQDLGTLGGAYSSANGINSSGQIVGSSYLGSTGGQHAFLYENGVMQDLGNFGGLFDWSTAVDINDKGQILGGTYFTENNTKTVIYHNGVTTDLGFLNEARWTDGIDINNLGQVVGVSGTRGFFYDGAAMYELADLMIGLQPGAKVRPVGINDAGQIAATVTFTDGTYRAYLLTPSESPIPTGPSPVPVPAAAWLFGSAVLGLAGLKKHRKTAATC